MYKLFISMCIAIFLLFGCSEAERAATVDKVTYTGGEVTILFKDGLILTTPYYDEGIQSGDTVYVIHKNNGDVVVHK